MGCHIKQLEKGNVQWWLYEVNGVSMQDQNNWREFVFDDATIVNGKQLSEYLKTIDSGNNTRLSWYRDSDLSNLTFIVVQTVGEITKGNEKKKKEQARNRAHEIVGLLYFVILYLSHYHDSICFSAQLYNSSGMQTTMIGSKKEVSVYQENTSNEHWIKLQDPPLSINIEELINILSMPYFRYILSAINNHNETICAFIRNFYITTNSNSPILQQIGSVTSIELLLKDDKKYEEVSKRIEMLISHEEFNTFIQNNETGVLKKRHLIIHEGNIPDSNDAFRAIKLASMVLINYSYLLTKYKTKKEVCKYLDLLNLLKNDNVLKNIDFNQSKHFEEIENLLPHTDWIIQLLIRYYGICSSKIPANLSLEISKAIACYAKIREFQLEKAYTLLTRDIYYNRQYIPDYNDFLDLHHDNIQEINDSIDLNLRFHNYQL